MFPVWFKGGKKPPIIRRKKISQQNTQTGIKHKELLSLWAVLEPGTEQCQHFTLKTQCLQCKPLSHSHARQTHTFKNTHYLLYQLQKHLDCCFCSPVWDFCSNYGVNSAIIVSFKWMVFSSLTVKITAGHFIGLPHIKRPGEFVLYSCFLL